MTFLRRCFDDMKFILVNDLFLFLFFIALSEGFQRFFHSMMAEAQNHPALMVPSTIGSIFAGLFETVFFILLVPIRILDIERKRPRSSFIDFMFSTMKPLTVEGLRAFAMVLLWLPALIVPGIVKMIRYTFVPYVVLADPRYDIGELDALQESNRLVKGWTIQLLLIQFGLVGFELLQTSFTDKFDLFAAPHIVLPGILLFSLINLFTNVLLFRIYLLRKNTLDAVS